MIERSVVAHTPFTTWLVRGQTVTAGTFLSALVTIPTLQTHLQGGPTAAPAAGGSLYRGVCAGTRLVVFGWFNTTPASPVVHLKGSLRGETAHTYEQVSVGDPFVFVRDLRWPFFTLDLENSSLLDDLEVVGFGFRIMTGPRGV